MPTIVGHAISSIGLGTIFARGKLEPTFWLLSIFCTVIPDIDSLMFFMGVPYGHMFGHRGFTHSIFFALGMGFIIMKFFYRNIPTFSAVWLKYFIYFSLITASHGILDAFTNGGLGVAFFSPFSNVRYFFPWRPIEVAPIGGLTYFFSTDGLIVVRSEITWIGIPTTLVILGKYLIEQISRKRTI